LISLIEGWSVKERLVGGSFLSQLSLQIGAPNEELVVLTQSHTVLESAVNLRYCFGEANDDLRVAGWDLISEA
jgi:hypothetical protein